jgi:transcription elongation factor GreA
MPETSYLTAEGAARLKAELEELKGPARTTIAERLRSAIQMGDLSENADYHKAKEDQSFLEGRIQELEYLLHNATIVDDVPTQTDEVVVGSRVIVKDEKGEKLNYQVVGSKEANPRQGRISNESPIGRVLMGAKVGDTVTAETPAGALKFKILKIE